jgi:hypothetical protein
MAVRKTGKHAGKAPQAAKASKKEEKDAKKKKKEETGVAVGEQRPLLDVGPKNLEKMLPIARRYNAAKKTRIKATIEEVATKAELLALVLAAKLQPLEDGRIRFEIQGCTVEATPRDFLIKITEKKVKE